MRPSIGVVVNCTNSYSRGYLAYLASIDSWSTVADQIVIVDGETTDESYETLKNWIKARNFEVHRVPESLWGTNGRWHAGQWTINTNIGLSKLETDWAFVICADYILRTESIGSMHKILMTNCDESALTYKRTKLDNQGREYLTPLRGIALNLKRIRTKGLAIGFGIDSRTLMPSDYPIFLERYTQFIDPLNGAIKKIYQGDRISVGQHLDLTSMVYGHYFFNLEQVIKKIMEYNQIYQVRFAKRAPKSRKMIIKEFGLLREKTILSKGIELDKPHPPEIKRVIENFYRPDMVGHAGVVAASQSFFTRNSIRMYQAIRTGMFSLTSFPSVQESQEWQPIKGEPASPLELKYLYQRQDKYLPRELRINWDS
jgi:hypothetical protein